MRADTGIVVCLFVTLFFSLQIGLVAQPQNRIEGRLQPSPPGPLPQDARVVLKRHTGTVVSRASVSGSGRFTFDSLPAGKYVVVFDAEGFNPVEQAVEILSGMSVNIYNVLIPIMPRQASDEIREGSSKVSLQSLSVPKLAVEEMARAEEAARKKDYRSGITHLEKAVAIAPNYFQAFNNLGVYRYQLDEKDKAIQAFEKALLINSEALDPHSNLGTIYLELSRPDQALPHLKRAAQLSPSSTRLSYQLGRAYILMNQFGDAIEPLRRSLELEPPILHAHFLLAHVFYELGRKAEAVLELRRYLQTRPKDRENLEEKLKQWEAEVR